jgi:hypothetical protein
MAEKLSMSVHKFLTGNDGPMSNVEMTLWNTYHIATARFQQQQNTGKGKRR